MRNQVDSNSALMARQQMRLNTIEENLKTVRGTLETEFRAIRMKIEEMATANDDLSTQTGVKLKELRGQIGELGDTLDIFNQRLRRSIELSSDIEFRVLRLEKRMQTLLTMSSDNLADAILQDDVSGAGTAPSVSMSRDNDTGGSVWTVEKDEALETELAKSAPLDNSTDNASTDEIAAAPSQDAEAQADDSSEASASDDNKTQLADTSAPSDTPEQQPEEVVEQALKQSCQKVAQKSNIALPLAVCCKMILKQPKRALPNSASFTPKMSVQQTSFIG